MEGQPAAKTGLERASKPFLNGHALPSSAFPQRRSSVSKDAEFKQFAVSCSIPFGYSNLHGIRRVRHTNSNGSGHLNSTGQPGSVGNFWLVSCLSQSKKILLHICKFSFKSSSTFISSTLTSTGSTETSIGNSRSARSIARRLCDAL